MGGPKVLLNEHSGAYRTFLRLVPEDLVLDFFKCIGYKTLNDENVFSKRNLTDKVKQEIDELISILYPYYRLNMQYRIVRNTSDDYYIKVLRSLATNSFMVLKSCVSEKTGVFYRLINPRKSKSILPPINCEVSLEVIPKKLRKIKNLIKPEFVRIIENYNMAFS
jgi:hypothetical protein